MAHTEDGQFLLHEHHEEKADVSDAPLCTPATTQAPASTGSIIGAAKGEFVLPPNFEEQSVELDREIAREFSGDY